MNNPQIPPTTPPQLQLQTQKTAPVAGPLPPAAAVPVAREALVRNTPKPLKNAEKPVRIEGRVVASNPQTGETRIATPKGEITVQTQISLPPGTEVTVDLYMQKAHQLANIYVSAQKDEAAQSLQQAVTKTAEQIQPPPPLKEGQTVQALLVTQPPPQGDAEENLPVLKDPITLEQAARIIEQVQLRALASFPVAPPRSLPLETIRLLLTTPDPRQQLHALPALQQTALVEFLEKPQVFAFLHKNIPAEFLPPFEIPALLQNATAPANLSLQDQAFPDGNILQIIKAQISARITQDFISGMPEQKVSPAQGAQTGHPIQTLLQNIFPVIENLQASIYASPAGTTKNILFSLPSSAPLFFTLKVVSIFPPAGNAVQTHAPAPQLSPLGQPVSPPVASLKPGQELGQVIALTKNGFPVIETENKAFVLRAPADVPVGSTVVFEATPLTPEEVFSTAPLSLNPLSESFDPLTSGKWAALEETLHLLAQSGPQGLAQAVRNTIPAPAAARLPAAALFFMAALRLGGIEQWLGENTLQVLRQQGRKDLAERLTGDFGKISTQSREPISGGEWRGFSMPMLHDDNLSQIQLYVRQQNDAPEKDGRDGEKTTRFILNLHLSRLGDMQLDGLLRQKRLDLILRSQDPFPVEMRQEMMQKFASGLDATSLQGGISFQTRKEHWVAIDSQKHQETIV